MSSSNSSNNRNYAMNISTNFSVAPASANIVTPMATCYSTSSTGLRSFHYSSTFPEGKEQLLPILLHRLYQLTIMCRGTVLGLRPLWILNPILPGETKSAMTITTRFAIKRGGGRQTSHTRVRASCVGPCKRCFRLGKHLVPSPRH